MWPLNLECYEVVKSNGKKIYNQPVDLSFIGKKIQDQLEYCQKTVSLLYECVRSYLQILNNFCSLRKVFLTFEKV